MTKYERDEYVYNADYEDGSLVSITATGDGTDRLDVNVCISIMSLSGAIKLMADITKEIIATVKEVFSDGGE